jgi:hypothetical protein
MLSDDLSPKMIKALARLTLGSADARLLGYSAGRALWRRGLAAALGTRSSGAPSRYAITRKGREKARELGLIGAEVRHEYIQRRLV